MAAPHVVRTTHIREMLADALRLAELAESDQSGVALQNAAIQANHAAAELQDEWSRLGTAPGPWAIST